MKDAASHDRMAWFDDARYGLMIHWGLYSLLGRGTWVMHNDQLSVAHMKAVADRFSPTRFDARAWADLAVEAGMKYAVFTTRHHDGFCLFDSSVSDFTAARHTAKRDFVADYVSAFRAAGLRVGLYYSLLDWRFPGYHDPEKYPRSRDAVVQQAHDQVRELLTNYGKIDLLWFDGGWLADIPVSIFEHPELIPVFWRSEELLAMARELQPDIVINDRAGLPADYDTPEQVIRASRNRRWEVCQTIGEFEQSWSCQIFTPRPIRKSTGQLLLQLVTTVRQGGNFLLNVGPSPEGEIEEADVERLRELGAWMRVHGEAMYGCERACVRDTSVGRWTFKGNTGYLCLLSWPGTEFVVVDLEGQVESATLLGDGRSLEHSLDPVTDRLTIGGLPAVPPHPDINVVKVAFRNRPSIRRHDVRGWWIGAPA